MKYGVKIAVVSTIVLSLSACSSSREWGQYPDGSAGPTASRPSTAGLPPVAGGVSDYPSKLGDTYKVGGKSYTPEDVQGYDEVGYASWYGEELAGNPTANGERFNPQGISAAHKILPLPTYVEVTALDTGKTILLRINDRGPFANDRILDLSHGAAKQLGIDSQGVSGVRVRKVNPNEQERAVLRNGGIATQRIDTPDSLLAILRKNLGKLPRPANVVRQAQAPIQSVPPRTSSGTGASYNPPVVRSQNQGQNRGIRNGRFIMENAGRPTSVVNSVGNNYVGGLPGSYVVQVAAFGSKSRATAMARKIGAKVMRNSSGSIWRVRYGPYASQKDAQAGLAQAKQRGYSNARILRADR